MVASLRSIRRAARALVLTFVASGGPSATMIAIPVVIGAAACKQKETPTPQPEKVAATPESPVPAPEGLAVEAIVRSPDAIVQSFRAIHPLLPDKAAPVLADLLHVNRETTE